MSIACAKVGVPLISKFARALIIRHVSQKSVSEMNRALVLIEIGARALLKLLTGRETLNHEAHSHL